MVNTPKRIKAYLGSTFTGSLVIMPSEEISLVSYILVFFPCPFQNSKAQEFVHACSNKKYYIGSSYSNCTVVYVKCKQSRQYCARPFSVRPVRLLPPSYVLLTRHVRPKSYAIMNGRTQRKKAPRNFFTLFSDINFAELRSQYASVHNC